MSRPWLLCEHDVDAGVDQHGHGGEQQHEHAPGSRSATSRCAGRFDDGRGASRSRNSMKAWSAGGRRSSAPPGRGEGASSVGAVMGNPHDRAGGRSARKWPRRARGSRAAARRRPGPRRSVLDTSRRGTSTRSNAQSAGRRDVDARALDDDELGPVAHLVDALPGRHAGRRVLADDHEERHGSGPRRAARRRCRPCSVAAPAQLEVAGLEPVDVGDRGGHHGQAIGGRAERAGADLLPRSVRDGEQHPVELQGVAHVDGGDEMARRGADRTCRRRGRFARRSPESPAKCTRPSGSRHADRGSPWPANCHAAA